MIFSLSSPFIHPSYNCSGKAAAAAVRVSTDDTDEDVYAAAKAADGGDAGYVLAIPLQFPVANNISGMTPTTR